MVNGTVRASPPCGARLPKLCGVDAELGNFIEGLDRPGGTGHEASRALLREIPGVLSVSRIEVVDSSTGETRSNWHAQDWGRKFLPCNGGCCYIDLDHLEVCLPEVLTAYDHVAAWHAMLEIVRAAMEAAAERLPEGEKLHVLVNNSDGEGNAYGSHLSFLVTRDCWDDIFLRKLQYLLYLAAYQVSSIVCTGQGKVGSENGAPPVAYQIAQRADFFEQLTGLQTTYARPIVNSRDESLCGRRGGMARLHVIFYDNSLCEVTALLKVGVMQIILAMIEAGAVDLGLTLEDPLQALRSWSHDPDLGARAATCDGRNLSAVEVQLLFHEAASRFVARGGCEGIVPRAQEILALWGDTLEKLRARDWDRLAPRLDWVLKRVLLEQAIDRHRDLSWTSPAVKHLDHLYASLDRHEGLFWQCRDQGIVERVVDATAIERFKLNPPANTRAWTRAMLLRRAGHAIEEMDWDSMRFWLADSYWFRRRTLEMSNPLGFTAAALAGADIEEATIEETLDLLEGSATDDDPDRAAEREVPARASSPGREEEDSDEGA